MSEYQRLPLWAPSPPPPSEPPREGYFEPRDDRRPQERRVIEIPMWGDPDEDDER